MKKQKTAKLSKQESKSKTKLSGDLARQDT